MTKHTPNARLHGRDVTKGVMNFIENNPGSTRNDIAQAVDAAPHVIDAHLATFLTYGYATRDEQGGYFLSEKTRKDRIKRRNRHKRIKQDILNAIRQHPDGATRRDIQALLAYPKQLVLPLLKQFVKNGRVLRSDTKPRLYTLVESTED